MDLFTHELRIDTVTGLAQSVRQVLSPHADARPNGSAPELIVVHGISLPPREFGGPWIDRLFTGNLPPDAHPFFREIAGSRVSAHAVIDRAIRAVRPARLARGGVAVSGPAGLQ
jgi:N-acetyl-anhydromuramoyl-L-alanine amidase